ncbi:CYFA0S12e00670g1_1 [Cyberlindnera fabianii]|uniref:CYFA0S12e00670g1_1 n=1 Tax=Cyberlindnera fabianii TaxID=36022 RepID=A0A061B1X3_CYBFA|nr:hypothetical protein BON22_5395 [Cyberlindnera fabianii]CDR43452.1 CYFA0S12e00670g1_1 [Cyberlindnera fabianii]
MPPPLLSSLARPRFKYKEKPKIYPLDRSLTSNPTRTIELSKRTISSPSSSDSLVNSTSNSYSTSTTSETGKIAGIVIGIVLAIAIIAIMWFCLRRRKKKREKEEAQLAQNTSTISISEASSDIPLTTIPVPVISPDDSTVESTQSVAEAVPDADPDPDTTDADPIDPPVTTKRQPVQYEHLPPYSKEAPKLTKVVAPPVPSYSLEPLPSHTTDPFHGDSLC